MVNMNINLTPEQQALFQLTLTKLQQSGILTDYHGVYPQQVVLHIGWKPKPDSEPQPVIGHVSLGFAAS